MDSESNRKEGYSLPLWIVGLLAVPVTILGGLFGKTERPSQEPQDVARAKSTSSSHGQEAPQVNELEFPFLTGAPSFPASRWEDPFIARASARQFFANEKKQRDDGREVDDEGQVQDQESIGIRKLLREKARHRFLVLCCIVPGLDDGRSVEKRIRTRHAVEAALSTTQFVTEVGDRISYLRIPNVTSILVKPETPGSTAHSGDSPLIVPIKVHRLPAGKGNDETPLYSLTLWVNESFLGIEPWTVIKQIVDEAFGKEPDSTKNISLAVIGPSSSSMLRSFLHAKGDPQSVLQDYPGGCKLFVTHATVKLEDLQPKDSGTKPQEKAKRFPEAHLAFIIGDDDALQAELRNELRSRNAWPSTGGFLGKKKVLILAEGDSLYVEKLRESFTKTLTRGESASPLRSEQVVALPFDKQLTPLKSGDSSTTSPPEAIKGAIERILAQYSVSEFVAVGILATEARDKVTLMQVAKPLFPGSVFFTFDYDSALHETPNLAATRNLTIVSHFGREIRIQPELIGKRHAETVHLPEFRSTYQTASFLASLLACRTFAEGTFDQAHLKQDDQDLFDLWQRKGGKQAVPLDPLVFEIGRTGPLQLATRSSSVVGPISHALPTRSELTPKHYGLWTHFGVLLVICVSVLFAIQRLSPHSEVCTNLAEQLGRIFEIIRMPIDFLWRAFTGRSRAEVSNDSGPNAATARDWITVLSVAVGVLGILSAYAIGQWPFQEIVRLTDGTSVWPSIGVLYVVACVALSKCVDLISDVNRNRSSGDRETNNVRLRAIRDGFSQAFEPGSQLPELEVSENPAFMGTVIFVLIGLLSLGCNLVYDGVWRVPARGSFAIFAGYLLTGLAWILTVFLACVTLAVGIIMRTNLRKILDAELKPSSPPQKLVNANELVKAIQATGKLTRNLGFQFVNPSLLLLVMVIAVSRYTDDWSFSLTGALIALMPLWVCVSAYWVIRTTAIRLRDRSIEKLQDMLISGTSLDGPKKDWINATINRVRELKEGSLGSALSDPVLGGILAVIVASTPAPARALITWFSGVNLG